MTPRDVLIKRFTDHHGHRIVAELEADGWLKCMTEAGFSVVPVEADREMRKAGAGMWEACGDPEEGALATWSAMIRAAQGDTNES